MKWALRLGPKHDIYRRPPPPVAPFFFKIKMMHALSLFDATSSSSWVLMFLFLTHLLVARHLSILSETTCVFLVIALVSSKVFFGKYSILSDTTIIILMLTNSFDRAAFFLFLLYEVDVVFGKAVFGPALILDYVADVAVLFSKACLIVAIVACCVGKEAAQELINNLSS